MGDEEEDQIFIFILFLSFLRYRSIGLDRVWVIWYGSRDRKVRYIYINKVPSGILNALLSN